MPADAAPIVLDETSTPVINEVPVPKNTTLGALVLCDGAPPCAGAGVSDVVTFGRAGVSDTPVASLFSDAAEKGEKSGADITGEFPLFKNPIFLAEIVLPSGADGATYTPTDPAQPGFQPDHAGEVTYQIISDPAGGTVPEPGTLILFGTGLAGLLGLGRRKALGFAGASSGIAKDLGPA